MNIDLSPPFVMSAQNVLTTMASCSCEPGNPILKRNAVKLADVTGLIGLAGEKSKGVFSLSFPEKVILDITQRMLGEEISVMDETVTDMVGELTNMISGAAKKILGDQNYNFDMALPLVITGQQHQILNKSRGAIIVPLVMDSGEFFIEVCFEETLK